MIRIFFINRILYDVLRFGPKRVSQQSPAHPAFSLDTQAGQWFDERTPVHAQKNPGMGLK
jgi:hypothetical protein